MEVIHVELSDEGMNVAMSEVGRQNLLFECIHISNCKFLPRGEPANDSIIVFILPLIMLTYSISYVFLMKRATVYSMVPKFLTK